MNQFQMVYIAHGTLWTLRTRNLDARAAAVATATGMQGDGRSPSGEIPNAEGSSTMGTTTRARHPFGIARVGGGLFAHSVLPSCRRKVSGKSPTVRWSWFWQYPGAQASQKFGLYTHYIFTQAVGLQTQ